MKIAIGTAQFGLDYGISNTGGAVNKEEIENILFTAKNNNISLLDTAQAYGNSEANIGMADSRKFGIITKLNPGIVPNRMNKSIQNSLENLKRKQIYGMLFHDFNDYLKNPECLTILQQKKNEGQFQKVGFSLYYPHELDTLINDNISFDILQIPFNVFDQRFKPYFKELKKRNIEIHIRSVFLQGLVFLEPEKMGTHFSDYISHFREFHTKINQSGYSIVEVCLNYVNIQPEVDKIIIGICKEEELKTNLKALRTVTLKDKSFYNSFEQFQISNEKIILPFNWN